MKVVASACGIVIGHSLTFNEQMKYRYRLDRQHLLQGRYGSAMPLDIVVVYHSHNAKNKSPYHRGAIGAKSRKREIKEIKALYDRLKCCCAKTKSSSLLASPSLL